MHKDLDQLIILNNFRKVNKSHLRDCSVIGNYRIGSTHYEELSGMVGYFIQLLIDPTLPPIDHISRNLNLF